MSEILGKRRPKTQKGKKFLVEVVNKAYHDNAVMVALLKKLVPDMKYVEMDGDFDIKSAWDEAVKKSIEAKDTK